MRGIRQQSFVRADQSFDARSGMIEALGQPGDFVVAAHRYARREVAFTECVNAKLQLFEPAREALDDRIGAEADRQHDQGQPAEKSERHALHRHRPARIKHFAVVLFNPHRRAVVLVLVLDAGVAGALTLGVSDGDLARQRRTGPAPYAPVSSATSNMLASTASQMRT